MRVLLLAAILCSIHFRSGQTEVALTPTGKVQVCVRYSAGFGIMKQLQLTCTAHGALWSTSGFGEGLADQTRVPAYSLARTSFRVTTTDTSNLTNSSSITLSNFNFDDHGAKVSCNGLLPNDQQLQIVTLSVGPINCAVSLTASRVTADSAVIRWTIHTCLGAVPINYTIYWIRVGEYEIFNASSSNSQYEITGLAPSTRYVIVLTLDGYCGKRDGYTALVETLSDTPADVTAFSLAAVTAVLFLLLLLLTTVLVIVCKRSKLISAITMRKQNNASRRQGSGLELGEQQECAYKDMKPTLIGDVQMEPNPAYQLMETAMY